MPFFLGALIGGLLSAMGSLVGRVLVSLGIGYVTYSGFNASLTWAKAAVLAKMGGAPAPLLQILGVLQVGTCLSIFFSTLSVMLLLKGVSAGGAITRMVTK